MNVKPTNRFEGKIQFRHSGGLLLMMDEFYDCNLFYVYGGESPPGGQATGGYWLLPGNWLGSGRYLIFGLRPREYASFRYTSLCAFPQ